MTSKKGRPSIQSRLNIEKELREYFLQGYDGEFIARQTGHDIKTVRKYIRQFAQEINDSETDDFLERQKTERIRTIISFDRQIFEANQYSQEIKNEIKKFRDKKEPIPRHLLSLYLEAMKFIANITETKGSFSMEPASDKVLEKMIEEKMKNHGKTR